MNGIISQLKDMNSVNLFFHTTSKYVESTSKMYCVEALLYWSSGCCLFPPVPTKTVMKVTDAKTTATT